MGNLIFSIDSEFAYYFANKSQSEVDNLVQTEGSAAKAAKKEQVDIHLIVDIVTTADNLSKVGENVDYQNGRVNLVFNYHGLTSTVLTRTAIPVNREAFETNFITTTVTCIEENQNGGTPDSDSATDSTPKHQDDDVPGKGQPD